MFTIKELEQLITYNPTTSEFSIISKGPYKYVYLSKTKHGYLQFTFIDHTLKSKSVMAHRVAWFYTTYEWPKHTIDHINGIRDDNRIENLRDVTLLTNAENKVCGAYRHKYDGRFDKYIMHFGKRVGRSYVVQINGLSSAKSFKSKSQAIIFCQTYFYSPESHG